MPLDVQRSQGRYGPRKHIAPGALSRSLIGPDRERADQADLRRRTPAHHRADRAAGSFSPSMLSHRPLPGCGPGRMHGHPGKWDSRDIHERSGYRYTDAEPTE
jgi:hypothetical protein